MTAVKQVLNGIDITNDTPLLELGIDSMTFIRLVVEIEEQLDIEIQDEDIVLDNFSAVPKIVEMLRKYA